MPISISRMWQFQIVANYFLFRVRSPTHRITIPIARICVPCIIQSGFECMNDDSGPINDWP
jgi:hypothetical protein